MRSVMIIRAGKEIEPFALEALIAGILDYTAHQKLEDAYEIMDSLLSNIVTDSLDELNDKMLEPTTRPLSIYEKEKYQHYLNEKKNERYIRFFQLRQRTLSAFSTFLENFNDPILSMSKGNNLLPKLEAERNNILFVSLEQKKNGTKTKQ
ncbi:hypothetical protein [Klebsiella phage YC1]|jgi:hypothetical protein|nr:hypothetical protein [Klebsiella phage YC1]WPH68819.1 hypothetical protein [Stenotrophomonas phage BUCTxx100]